MTVRFVTGFIPIKNHPRPIDEYKKLGERLFEFGKTLPQPILVWYGTLADTWLGNYLADSQKRVYVASADNPTKNTLAYHCVQHQKTEWIYGALMADGKTDVFIWVDYGIFSVPGVTEQLLRQVHDRAEKETAIAIPGCWADPGDRGDDNPNWRFCGGLIIVPRAHVFALDVAVKAETLRHLNAGGKLTWEVNTLARVELRHEVPLWWYAADHNEKMFANYPETHRAS